MGRKDTKRNSNNKKSSTLSQKKNQTLTKVSAASFPEEVVLNILARLPVKSLFRFKCVCKTWRSNIENPSFIKAHFNYSITRPQGSQLLISFSNSEGSRHYFYSSSFFGGKASFRLSLPGCNKGANSPCQCSISESHYGLVCFNNGRNIYILNPTTKISLRVPASEISLKYPKLVKSSVNSVYSKYYFGFNPLTEEHKLLHIFGVRDIISSAKLYDLQCEVLTRKANSRELNSITAPTSWKKIYSVPPYPFISKEDGVCINGVMYWMGIKSPGQEIVVVFNFASETFCSVSLPNIQLIKPCLTQVRGHLALLNFEDGKNSNLELWVLKDCRNSIWSKEGVLLWNDKKRRFRCPVVVGNASTKEFLMMPSLFQHQYDLVCYDNYLKKDDKTDVKTISVRELPPSADFSQGVKNINFNVTNHVESLMPVAQLICLKFGEFVAHVEG